MKKTKDIILQRKNRLINLETKLNLPDHHHHDKILSMSLIELQNAMNHQEFTSYQLVSLYISRCLNFGQQLNAITQEFYLEALESAKKSDQRRAIFLSRQREEMDDTTTAHEASPRVEGVETTEIPTDIDMIEQEEEGRRRKGRETKKFLVNATRLLEGIPFSVKDCYDQIGADNFCGLASRIGQVSQHDCPLILLLKQAGAIPFIRSNVPPILMAWETANYSYGSTNNPWNINKITGGSSGGEAALISSRCSPIGLGTDIGGSLRIPAACCGIYSLKPTTRRLSTQQLSCQEVPGQISILSSPGPMGRCVSDLDLIMRVWLQPRASVEGEAVAGESTSLNHRELPSLWYHDPYTPPTIWRNPLPGE
jgi:Asp-tRNA(Asn)/Glu-tRNA(Gln) amidotransferase A subunit family amidase